MVHNSIHYSLDANVLRREIAAYGCGGGQVMADNRQQLVFKENFNKTAQFYQGDGLRVILWATQPCTKPPRTNYAFDPYTSFLQ